MSSPVAAEASSAPVIKKTGDESAPKKVINKNKKRTKLIRPRGKRGGVKNRKPSAKGVATEGDKKAGELVKKVEKKLKAATEDAEDDESASPSPEVEAPTAHSLQISHFHALLKELNQPHITTGRRLAIEAEIDSFGGLEAYQDASLIGADKTKGGESGKWCAAALREIVKENKHEDKIRLLDVGALGGTAYTAFEKWIDVTSIDLNPRGENVQQYDFFDYPVPKDEEDKFDVVCLSLVLNFVGDLNERGELLLHAHSYLSSAGGYLYLVLPLPCVANSRYLDHTRLEEILDSTGWEVVKNGDSRKLTRWLLKSKPAAAAGDKKSKGPKGKGQGHPYWDGQVWKKEEIRVSATANNFCIKVRAGSGEAPGPGGAGKDKAAAKKRKTGPPSEGRDRKTTSSVKRDGAKGSDRRSPGGKRPDARAGGPRSRDAGGAKGKIGGTAKGKAGGSRSPMRSNKKR